jgi:hypothetical protein
MAVDHQPAHASPPPAVVRAAFDEVHGARLHGFALLLTLGEADRAARLTRAALAAAAPRARELRHPERAAAWLRARVVARAGRERSHPGRDAVPAPLVALGVDLPTFAGLAALAPRERAAIVAAVVERLDARDVETIVGRGGAALERMLVSARRRFVEAHAATAGAPSLDGPFASRLTDIATRALR